MSIPNASIDALPVRTAAHRLAAVQEAITNVLLGGQSYTLPDGTRVERPPLDKLLAMEADLTAEVASTDDTTLGGIALVQYGERQ